MARVSALLGGEACPVIVRVHAVITASNVDRLVAAADIISAIRSPDCVSVRPVSAERTVPTSVHAARGDMTAARQWQSYATF